MKRCDYPHRDKDGGSYPYGYGEEISEKVIWACVVIVAILFLSVR